MRAPNFFVIGAPRCGTSTFHEGLRQHPQVFMPEEKEPWYYAFGERTAPFKGPKDELFYHYLNSEQYAALFVGARDEVAVGEASTIYLFSEQALARLRAERPDAKFLAILRNPIDRGYSNFLQHQQQGREPLRSYRAALEAEPSRRAADWAPYWFYLDVGFYGRQLQRYYDAFGAERVKVFLLEDLQQDAAAVYRAAFEFLGVDPSFVPPNAGARRNKAGMPRNAVVHRLLTTPNAIRTLAQQAVPFPLRRFVRRNLMRRRKLADAPPLPADLRAELVETYRDDIRLLESLLGRELEHWLSRGAGTDPSAS